MGFSAWKPFPQYFTKIIHEKPREITVERQVKRKWKKRDKNATALKVGRWFIIKEKWNLQKLKQIFRANTKRHRSTYNSYQLFLDDRKASSKAWNVEEMIEHYSKTPWTVNYPR